MSTASKIIYATYGKDVFVDYDDTAVNYETEYLMCGIDTMPASPWPNHYGRPYFHFDLTPLNRAGVTITSATLTVTSFWTAANYSDFTVDVHKANSDYTASSITWASQPTLGSSIATITAIAGGMGELTSTSFASTIQAALSSNYIVLCLNDGGYSTYGMNLKQTSHSSSSGGRVTYLTIQYTGGSFSGSLLANVCGDASAPYDGTTVRGSSASSNANEYSITAGGSSITPTSITQGVTSNITFNPGSGAQVGRITTSRTYTWSKVSGITGTLGSTTSNPCTLNCAGTGTYTIQCVYYDDYTGTVTVQQAISVVAA